MVALIALQHNVCNALLGDASHRQLARHPRKHRLEAAERGFVSSPRRQNDRDPISVGTANCLRDEHHRRCERRNPCHPNGRAYDPL